MLISKLYLLDWAPLDDFRVCHLSILNIVSSTRLQANMYLIVGLVVYKVRNYQVQFFYLASMFVMLHLLLGLSALWSEMFHLIWSVAIYIFLPSFCFPTLSGASLNVDKYNNVYLDLNCCDIYRLLATSLPSQIVITSSGSFTLFCNI